MKKIEDAKAILARREAFINRVLSKEETANAIGGKKPCLTTEICLKIGEPCLAPVEPCLKISEPCLSIEDPTI